MATEHEHALSAGDLVEEYRVEAVLGSGSFGITYLVTDQSYGTRYALKEYFPEEFAHRTPDGVVEAVGREWDEEYDYGAGEFIRECLCLAAFRHPNIIGVYRVFKASGTAYMVLELAEGDTLAQVLNHSGVLSYEQVRQIFGPLLGGISEIHKLQIWHRDIKPGNIIIRHGGSPVLIDFGAARLVSRSHSGSELTLLTPPYAPPEQYNSPEDQGPGTDIYALAVSIYVCLTGQRPPESIARIGSDGVDQMPAFSKFAASKAPDAFLKAIDWGLNLDIADRPQSVSDWRKAMEFDRDPDGTDVRGPGAETRAAANPVETAPLVTPKSELAELRAMWNTRPLERPLNYEP